MITIGVACNDLGDREAIIATLRKQDDFNLACIAEDGFDLIQSAMTQALDVAIMDFHLADIESPDLAPIIKRRSPATSLIVLCSQEDRDVVEEALKAGISGCLKKQRGFDNLASSVRSVYYGGLYISSSDWVTVPHGFALRAQSPQCETGVCPVFSPTELGIFCGISLGHTDPEIASNLNITTGTLRNYVSHAKKKTGFHNRTQITIYALLNGMIRPYKFTA